MDVVLGMGEVGSTLYKLLKTRGFAVVGIDADSSKNKDSADTDTIPGLLHVCIPGDIPDFADVVLGCAGTRGVQAILIHSTVPPGTAASLQAMTAIPIISAPARGVHRRFLTDMQRYTKFVAAERNVDDGIKRAIQERFQKVEWMSGARTLEMAKILVDTSYYGWLINFAQITKMICDREGIDYDEMWTFADEIHRYLGNRPKMYPGIIGGHCVIPNLNLLEYPHIQTIKQINEMFQNHASKSP